MSRIQELPITAIQFYATAPYPCSYLPDQLLALKWPPLLMRLERMSTAIL